MVRPKTVRDLCELAKLADLSQRLPCSAIAAFAGVVLVMATLMAVAVSPSGGYSQTSCGRGFSAPLAATDERGETLVAWQDGKKSEGGFCESAVADVAIGSTGAGFVDLGAVSAPGELSYATGVSLDGAGDGWVIGLHEVYAREEKYGPSFEKSGVWVAFRPAGGSFMAPIELPTRGTPVLAAWVASNRAGRTLLAWSTYSGTYLAFGTTTGAISKATFVGGGFQVGGLGVDENGRALIVGYYGSKQYEAIRIAAVTADVSGSFSRPRVLAAQPRNARKDLVGYFSLPLVAIGPRGNAVIVWESTWANPRTDYESPGSDLLIYRRADGHFDKPVRLPNGFLSESATAAVDGTGRAIIASATVRKGLKEVAVSPDGGVDPQHRLWSFVNEVSAVSNARGQTIISWVDGGRPIKVIEGNTRGINNEPQTIDTPDEVSSGEIAEVVSPQGKATLFWVEEPRKQESVLFARAVVPGAQPVKIASSEPVAR